VGAEPTGAYPAGAYRAGSDPAGSDPAGSDPAGAGPAGAGLTGGESNGRGIHCHAPSPVYDQPAMSADHVVVMVAVGVAVGGAVVAVMLVATLGRQLRALRALVEDLRSETIPLVRDARVAVDQASTEMVRVGGVLESTGAVTATVDSASRLVYRAFANPVVRTLAFCSGIAEALRRLFGHPRRSMARAVATPATGDRDRVRRHRHRGTKRLQRHVVGSPP
jgi:hypothetical protein